MISDKQELNTANLPVLSDDGFEDSSNSDRLLQGTRAICIDGKWTKPDGTEIPSDKQFLVLGTAEGLQHWQDGALVEEIIKKPVEPLPDVAKLNAEIPEDTWEDGINGPRPPWVHRFAAYLLDLSDGSIFTHMNHTTGAIVAVRELKSRVKWKRALLGRKVMPIVSLGKRLVSKTYQKWGPDFIIVDWRDFGPLPATSAPRQLESHAEQNQLNDPVADVGRPVNEPGFAEILDDEIPEKDWAPPGEPMQRAAEKTPPQQEDKQAPAACRTTTKRGGTRIGRRK
jgi:hypothetical protein